MVHFDPQDGGLPSMEVDRDASGEGRLVFVRRPRRSCGLTLGVVGMGLLVASGVLASGERRAEGMAVLALGVFGAAIFLCLGVVSATSRSRLIVDKEQGLLIGSWWFLGIENPTKAAIGKPLRVSWSREVHTTSDANGTKETITFPVSLLSEVGGKTRHWRVFNVTRETDARRLTHELAGFLGVDSPGADGT